MCVNPVDPAGGTQVTQPYFAVASAGLLGGGVQPFDDESRTDEITTPFVSYPDMVAVECIDDGRFGYLQMTITTDDGPRTDDVGGDLTPEWGMHLIDVNVAMGDLVDLVIRVQTSTLDGRPVLTGIGADITDRIRAEEQRRELEGQLWRAQKLEALGTLASGITHDFNNLLMAISGYTELATQQLPPGSPGADHLERVLRAADRGKALAQQVLTFSRASEQPRQRVELGSVVRESLDLLLATLPATIRLDAEVADSGCVVHADAGQLGQVVTNLCTNAAQACTDTGAAIEVRLERVEVGTEEAQRLAGLEPGPHACLTVSDNGSGMTPDVMERVFDPFFTTKDLEGGTGLGLAVVHGIVHAHGGATDITSEPGSGTAVRVVLPCLDRAESDTSEPDATTAHGNGRILLVDDEESLADLMRQGLERFGYTVHAFSRSAAAYEAFVGESNSFDLVITDKTMPDMTGLELAEKVRDVRSDIPIILISGLGAPSGESVAMEQIGFFEVLIKPFALDELGSVVAHALAAER